MMGRDKYLDKQEEAPKSKKKERIAASKRSDFENPHGCLMGKQGCPGTPIRLVWVDSFKMFFFFCKCGFDTTNPSKEVYELAQGFGLLEKGE